MSYSARLRSITLPAIPHFLFAVVDHTTGMVIVVSNGRSSYKGDIMKYVLSAALGIGVLLALGAFPLSANRTIDRTALPGDDGRRVLEQAITVNRDGGAELRPGDPSAYFVAAMVPHVAQGSALAQKAVLFTEDPVLAHLAQQICISRTSYLKDIDRWKANTPGRSFRLSSSSSDAFSRLMQEVQETTREDMKDGLSAARSEMSFVTIMMARSQGAIDMAKVFLIFEGDRELSRVARRIIGEEQAHLSLMQDWLRQNAASGLVYRYGRL